MREAILGSLVSLLKAENFPGKRQYISELKGLEQLSAWICLHDQEEKNKLGEGAQVRKIRIKLIQLLYDFATNDDSIIDDGFHVRDTIANNKVLVE